MVENGNEDASSQVSVHEVVGSIESTLEENSIVRKPSGSDAVSPHPRMLVINSETFTVWKDHFARLQEVIKGWEPEEKSIITLGLWFF
jgi:platelet-activating factor acetylhydrolase